MTTEKNPWIVDAEKVFVGRTITGVRYMTEKEMPADWYFRSVVFTLDDGTEFFPVQDDECNGAGAIVSTHGDAELIPVALRTKPPEDFDPSTLNDGQVTDPS